MCKAVEIEAAFHTHVHIILTYLQKKMFNFYLIVSYSVCQNGPFKTTIEFRVLVLRKPKILNSIQIH
jgi:hypothetical protein